MFIHELLRKLCLFLAIVCGQLLSAQSLGKPFESIEFAYDSFESVATEDELQDGFRSKAAIASIGDKRLVAQYNPSWQLKEVEGGKGVAAVIPAVPQFVAHIYIQKKQDSFEQFVVKTAKSIEEGARIYPLDGPVFEREAIKALIAEFEENEGEDLVYASKDNLMKKQQAMLTSRGYETYYLEVPEDGGSSRIVMAGYHDLRSYHALILVTAPPETLKKVMSGFIAHARRFYFDDPEEMKRLMKLRETLNI